MKTETRNAQRLPSAAKRTHYNTQSFSQMKAEMVTPKASRERAAIAIRNILVPTDFSPASKKAFSYALRFAEELGSELTLLHVLEPERSLTLAGQLGAAFFEDEFGRVAVPHDKGSRVSRSEHALYAVVHSSRFYCRNPGRSYLMPFLLGVVLLRRVDDESL